MAKDIAGLDRLSDEAADLFRRDSQVLAGIEKLRFFPVVVERGEGATLIEAGGRELIDFTATWTAAGLGYGHPRITEAITRAAKNPGGMGLSIANSSAIAFAEELLAITPGGPDRKVYIGHAGSDACDVALRGVRFNSSKKKIVAFEHSYHGGIGLSMSVSGVHVDTGATKPDAETIFVPYPNPYRPPVEDPTPEGAMKASLSKIEEAFQGGEVACIIVEPILDDGGLVVPPKGFLAEIERLCQIYNVIMICDEVKVGLGRPGMLHAFQHDGVTPDIVCFGKAIGNGFPLSAAVGPTELLNGPTAAALLTTAGNPISAEVGRAVIRTLIEDDIPARTKVAGELMHRLFKELDSPYIGDVRGYGLVTGVELVTDRESKGIAKSLTAATVYRAFELGLCVFSVGPNVLEITPPMIISDEMIERGVGIIAQAIDDAAKGKVDPDAVAAFSGW